MIRDDEIDAICQLVDELCGIQLSAEKSYLIESRLRRILCERSVPDFVQLSRLARGSGQLELRHEIIDAITTNETLFFRDSAPFEALQHKAIPEAIDERARRGEPNKLRIWSAACSTGQEAYSIAILLHELIDDIDRWDIKILGTDISPDAISAAGQATYQEHEIARGLPERYRDAYLIQDGSRWRVRDAVRSVVRFQTRNLLDPFHGLEPFDIIFCRNVAIYFSSQARNSLFDRLANQLVPTGYLFVGASETMQDVGPRFQAEYHCRSVFYRPCAKVLGGVT